MPYSAVEDLLVGDTILGVSPEKFVQEAAEEMDGKLGFVYQLPIRAVGEPETEDFRTLPQHEQLLLRQINNKLASGALIMATASAEEQTAVHAYGLMLVKEARSDLMAIANDDVKLSAIRVTALADSRRLPSVKNHDEESLLLGFENTVMRDVPWYSRPGQVS